MRRSALGRIFERAIVPLGLDLVCEGCGGPTRGGAGVLVCAVAVEVACCERCGEELAGDGRSAWRLLADGSTALSLVRVHGRLADPPQVPA